MPIDNDGVMIILSSPSGAGKTTLVNLLSKLDNFEISISHTTRKPRPNEIPNQDYFFVSEDEFKRLIKNQEFLEYAKVFNNFYGSTRTPVINNLDNGKNVLFDIDWQGTQQLIERARADLVSVFILPPSTSELERRLRGRAQDTAEVVANRMQKASDEMSHYPEYDYIIVNDNLTESISMAMSILQSERLKRERLTGLGTFVKGLREGR